MTVNQIISLIYFTLPSKLGPVPAHNIMITLHPVQCIDEPTARFQKSAFLTKSQFRERIGGTNINRLPNLDGRKSL